MINKQIGMINKSNPRRAMIFTIVLTLTMLGIEWTATYGSMTGEPLNPVNDWSLTRPTDWLAFAVVVIGCGSIYWRLTHPALSLIVATLSYCTFILRDYELGMFLPVMVLLYSVVSQNNNRLWTIGCATASLVVSLYWLHRRLSFIEDSGILMLAWVAFGTVFGVFFIVPLLFGEIVWLRRVNRAAVEGN